MSNNCIKLEIQNELTSHRSETTSEEVQDSLCPILGVDDLELDGDVEVQVLQAQVLGQNGAVVPGCLLRGQTLDLQIKETQSQDKLVVQLHHPISGGQWVLEDLELGLFLLHSHSDLHVLVLGVVAEPEGRDPNVTAVASSPVRSDDNVNDVDLETVTSLGSSMLSSADSPLSHPRRKTTCSTPLGPGQRARLR